MTSRARQDAWFKHMNQLRNHMKGCRDCKGAIAAFSVHRMCLTGSRLVVSAAAEFDAVLEVKKKYPVNGTDMVHACPDIAAHGPAAALYAQPLSVIGIQDGLF